MQEKTMKQHLLVLCFIRFIHCQTGSIDITTPTAVINKHAGESVIMRIAYSLPLPVLYVEIKWFAYGRNDVIRPIWYTVFSEDPDSPTLSVAAAGLPWTYGASPANDKVLTDHYFYITVTNIASSGTYYAEVTYEKDGESKVSGRSPNIQLNVDSPPDPRLVAYGDGLPAIVEGGMAVLDCLTVPFYPLKFDVQMSNDTHSVQCEKTQNAVDNGQPLSLCRAHERFNRTNNRAGQWFCTVMWEDQTYTSIGTLIDVSFPPSNVTMTNSFPPIVPVDNIASLTCESDSANPAPTISWSKDGLTIPSTAPAFVITTSDKRGEYNGAIRVSTLSFTVSYELAGSVFTCSLHGYNSVAIHSDPLVVETPPQPHLLTYGGSCSGPAVSTLHEGQSVCVVCGTLPTVPNDGITMEIYMSSTPMNCSTGTSLSDNAGHICTSMVKVQREYNKAEWMCQVTWKQTIYNSTKTIYVHWPASNMAMSKKFPEEEVSSGSAVSITCQADSANPPAVIVWIKDFMQITNTDMFAITHTEKNEGNYSGTTSTSNLSFIAVWGENAGMYTCSILHNDTVWHFSSTLLVEEPLTLGTPKTTSTSPTTTTTVPFTIPVANTTTSPNTSINIAGSTAASHKKRVADPKDEEPEDSSGTSGAVLAGIGGIVLIVIGVITTVIITMSMRKNTKTDHVPTIEEEHIVLEDLEHEHQHV